MISLEGMYDLHIHPAPSIQRRRFTAIEAVKFASAERMAGVVFLDHTYNTTTMAETVNELGLHTRAYGTIMLNEAVGGVSPSVVEIALALGTRHIQLPTYSAKAHQDAYGDDQKIFPYKKRIKPIYILDGRGRLTPEVEEIMELMKGANAFLASGHISPAEVGVLAKRSREVGVRFMACSVSTDMPGYPLEAQEKWTDDGAFMEHCYLAVSDVPHVKTPIATIVEQIRTVGADQCVLCTDAGNLKIPDNVTAMREFVRLLLEAGLTDKEIDGMTRRNPAILLGVS
ncbi:MAG: hypothetical protein H6Q55_1970 [Deltaproteobacteria bacterium]|jgi:hypothetical protein|nr:hypothetical protein [Deltaproteobacteria bacterium]